MANALGGGGGSQKTPRYTDINLQTSAQGLPIVLLWGQNRLGTNLIWYGDFKSRTTKQAGKGGATGKGGSTYYYSTALIMALCEGPVQAIDRVWAGTTLTTLSKLDLTLFEGTATQAAWSYLTSNHPTQALAYARTAYVASGSYQLGSSPDLPSHNFEVTGALSGTVSGIPDANPADIIADYLTNPQYSIGLSTAKLASNLATYKTYCAAQGIFMSPVLDQQEQATQTIQRWAQLTNSFIFWSGNQLQFCPLGDSDLSANGATYTPDLTPVYNLSYDDFIVAQGEAPVTVDFIDPADGYNQVQIDMKDRSNAYNDTPIVWRDQTSIDQYGELMANVISAKEICIQSIAQICAALIGKRSVYITKKYTFKLPRRFIFMEPGDIYTVTDANIGLNNFPVRILSVKSGTDRILTVTAEEFPYGIGSIAAYSTQGADAGPTFDSGVAPGNINTPAIFEPSPAQTGGVPQVWVGASGGADWGGCNVYLSFDGVTYSEVGTILAGLLQGALITALPATVDPDTTDTLYVDLTESEGVMPATATHADADALRTLVLVDAEVMAYGTATPGTLNSYSTDLTYLRRGQYGTTVVAHAVGAPFTRLDPNFLFEYDLPAAYVGATLYFKFCSFNNFGGAVQDIADVPEYTYVPTGGGYVIVTPGVPTATPSTATQTDGTTILTMNVSWAASAGPNLGSYNLEFSTNGGTSWFMVPTVPGGTTAYTLAPALASTSYMFRVRAVSQNGLAISTWETSGAITSGALLTAPGAPTAIAVHALDGGASVTWTPSASLSTTGYQVSYGTTNVFSAATIWPETTSGPGLVISTLTPGTTYYFWVQAFNPAGASSADGPVSCVPTSLLSVSYNGVVTTGVKELILGGDLSVTYDNPPACLQVGQLNNFGTTTTLNMPEATTAGNLLVLTVIQSSNGYGLTATPTGFTQIASVAHDDAGCAVYTKTSTGEASVSLAGRSLAGGSHNAATLREYSGAASVLVTSGMPSTGGVGGNQLSTAAWGATESAPSLYYAMFVEGDTGYSTVGASQNNFAEPGPSGSYLGLVVYGNSGGLGGTQTVGGEVLLPSSNGAQTLSIYGTPPSSGSLVYVMLQLVGNPLTASALNLVGTPTLTVNGNLILPTVGTPGQAGPVLTTAGMLGFSLASSYSGLLSSYLTVESGGTVESSTATTLNFTGGNVVTVSAGVVTVQSGVIFGGAVYTTLVAGTGITIAGAGYNLTVSSTASGTVTSSTAGQLAWYSATGTIVVGNPNVTYSGGVLTAGVPGVQAGGFAIAGATSGTVTIQAAAAAGSWAMTLPSTAGSSGQVLTTNGTGVLSWTTPGGGGGSSVILEQNGTVLGTATTINVAAGLTVSLTSGVASICAGYSGSAHRYWRLVVGTNASGTGTAIAEVNFYASVGSTTNVATGGTASASTTYSGYPASNAFDGSATTFWSSNGVNAGEYIQYGLGVGYSSAVYGVKLTARPDVSYTQAPVTCLLEYSDDGSTFSPAYAVLFAPWYVAGQAQVAYYRPGALVAIGNT